MPFINVIYRKTIVPAAESTDGETPEVLYLTKEANCYILWHSSFDDSGTPLKVWRDFGGTRDVAIEHSVLIASEYKSEGAKA